MLTLLKLFGRSPFAPLRSHMEKVGHCVHKLEELFTYLWAADYDAVARIAKEIATLEHEADLAKNDIRNHLPKSLFLPVDRHQLLEILALQDTLADRAEDVAVLLTLKELPLPQSWHTAFDAFLHKNIEAFDEVKKIIDELQDLLESSFGGSEAEKVRDMVEKVAYLEHQADQLQFFLLRLLFAEEEKLSISAFFLWQKVLQTLAQLANLSETLAHRVRMTLELK